MAESAGTRVGHQGHFVVLAIDVAPDGVIGHEASGPAQSQWCSYVTYETQQPYVGGAHDAIIEEHEILFVGVFSVHSHAPVPGSPQQMNVRSVLPPSEELPLFEHATRKRNATKRMIAV